MKTFTQFINESVSEPAGNVTGCAAIEKMYAFLRDRVETDKLLKADRIEEINNGRFLVYTLDNDEFEKRSGISLNSITLKNATNEDCYRSSMTTYNWLDKSNNTKWGVFYDGFPKMNTAFIIIFIIDRKTKRVSTIEYAVNVLRLDGVKPDTLIGTYCDSNKDFKKLDEFYNSGFDFWYPVKSKDGCNIIKNMYNFLRRSTKSDKIFKADRIEEIDGSRFLIYTLNKDRFENLSGIPLYEVLPDDVKIENGYTADNSGDITCDWVDRPDKAKWGVSRSYNGGDVVDYIIIFTLHHYNFIHDIEYAVNVDRLDSDPEALLGTYLDKNEDFEDIWNRYDPSRC